MLGKFQIPDVLAHIKALKDSQRKIYGIMAHGLVPEELIYAAKGFPLRLSLTGDPSSAEKGIEYLTSATCSFARSTIGHFNLKNELYKELDVIIASNYCNGELCATELISKYFHIPALNIVFPSNKSPFALRFLTAELTNFTEELEQISDYAIQGEPLSEAISLYNRERTLYQKVVEIQTQRGPLLSGQENTALIYRHFLYGPEVTIQYLQSLLDKLNDMAPLEGRKKVLFAGNGVPFGDNILQLIENNGLLVTKNLTWTGLDYYQSLVEGNDLNALANYYLKAENSGRMILSNNYFTNLVKIFKASNLDGIIFYLVKYCSIFPSMVSYKLKQTLSAEGIPFLEIERDYGTTTDAQLLTRIQAFKEMLS
ncbi:MAG: 2-hydroxyacyl-CoA dehydratase family protein [Candidatus Helarchaeota archaeon]